MEALAPLREPDLEKIQYPGSPVGVTLSPGLPTHHNYFITPLHYTLRILSKPSQNQNVLSASTILPSANLPLVRHSYMRTYVWKRSAVSPNLNLSSYKSCVPANLELGSWTNLQLKSFRPTACGCTPTQGATKSSSTVWRVDGKTYRWIGVSSVGR
ncbi:hypothetical protein B0J17DRAFT_709021 [Rhizoctonia solani]|nr:hypothetical protein B0J17DRAFT_709021 [Rhizoctonia solani]